MTTQPDPRLKQFTDYFGLEVQYSRELPEKVSGFLKLDTDCACIVLNAHKPPCDHALTIAHEMAHYVMHQNRMRKVALPWYVTYPWKWKQARRVARMARAYLRKRFDSEWEADFWAFILLWLIGATDHLLAITKLYPEKMGLFWLSWMAVVFGGLRQRGINFFQGLLPIIPSLP